MRWPGILLGLTLALTFGAGCAKKGADLVYTNGRIFTADAERPWAEAAAVARGKFVCVGSNAEARAFIGMQTEVRDLGNRFVLPAAREPARAPYVVEPPDRLMLIEPISETRFQEYARLHAEERTGAIVVGNHADLLVLTEDPFEFPPARVRVVETVIEGRPVSPPGRR
jgi:predicted amidohydrolase YtcJ